MIWDNFCSSWDALHTRIGFLVWQKKQCQPTQEVNRIDYCKYCQVQDKRNWTARLQRRQQISHMWHAGGLRRQDRFAEQASRCLFCSSSPFSPLPWLCQHLLAHLSHLWTAWRGQGPALVTSTPLLDARSLTAAFLRETRVHSTAHITDPGTAEKVWPTALVTPTRWDAQCLTSVLLRVPCVHSSVHVFHPSTVGLSCPTVLDPSMQWAVRGHKPVFSWLRVRSVPPHKCTTGKF